jgi:hypothetical protein
MTLAATSLSHRPSRLACVVGFRASRCGLICAGRGTSETGLCGTRAFATAWASWRRRCITASAPTWVSTRTSSCSAPSWRSCKLSWKSSEAAASQRPSSVTATASTEPASDTRETPRSRRSMTDTEPASSPAARYRPFSLVCRALIGRPRSTSGGPARSRFTDHDRTVPSLPPTNTPSSPTAGERAVTRVSTSTKRARCGLAVVALNSAAAVCGVSRRL